MFAMSDSGRYGNISELTNRTLLTDSPIVVNFNDKIFTKIINYFEFHYLWRLIGFLRMAGNDNKIMRRRLANAYLSSVISISLVLLLVGVASLLLVNARGVSDYFKENMQVSVLMKQSVSDEDALEYREELEKMHFIKNTVFISKEQGERELADQLGDDFLDIFETSPIPVSIDVTLTADYVSADSLEVVKNAISRSKLVDEVVYQKTLVDALNSNLSRISMIIGIFVALLLFISYVLINNTVRLNVFARRFTIHTMKLVGATRSFIRAPFLVKSLFQGILSGLLAALALVGIMYLLRNEFVQIFAIFRMELIAAVLAAIVVLGAFICLVCTFFVVNRMVSLTNDELYY